jgi:BirA family transcriptional regulator, biotin operon repressor / biotin---[acetyl-CoA-carboxylase] ligase
LAIRIFVSTAANVGGVTDRAPNAPGAADGAWPPGWIVEHVAVTGSTNTDLLASAGERPDRSVVVADHQTAGKGRLDRRWDAAPGANLLVSILFHTVPAHPSELTRRVALAAVDACRRLTGVDVVLKWPNDLLVDERKLAGILAERSVMGDVVVGIGLNVGWCPDGAARLGDGIAPLDVLRELLAAYDRLPADVSDAYRAALVTLGRQVRIELADGVVEGTATDVEADGRLVVLDACAVTHRFAAGDVVHLRPS